MNSSWTRLVTIGVRQRLASVMFTSTLHFWTVAEKMLMPASK